jgi:uncharacterized membrane protein
MHLSTLLGKENVAALSYVLGPITGVVVYLLEKDEFIRFHAVQSIIVFGALLVLNLLFGFTFILAVVTPLLSVFTFILWLVLIYRAWQGDMWVVPFLGSLAHKLTSK